MTGRNPNSILLVCFVALAAAALLPLPAGAQAVFSNQVDVSLTATVVTEITFDVSSAAVDFGPLDVFGITPGTPQLAVTVTWNLPSGLGLSTCMYFDSATAALNDGGTNDIPSSDVERSVNSGVFDPITDTCNGTVLGVPGASRDIVGTIPITTLNNAGTSNSTIDLRINRTGDPLLPPGNYVGTLHLQAGAE